MVVAMAFDHLAVRPPVAPMLARLVRTVPRGDYAYEPKWDGFRALVFRDGDEVEIQSRHGRPFARYFPEVAAALRGLNAGAFVLDGEIVVVAGGRFDFARLMLRTHPSASRVASLSREAPATFVAFDVLAEGTAALVDRPFAERRLRLESMLVAAPAGVVLTPTTDDVDEATAWLDEYPGGGADGVVAKDRALPYEPGRRSMLKVKRERTADCVVAGFRLLPDGSVASLLLGLYDEAGTLRHIGIAASFARQHRRELFAMLAPLVVPVEAHPWGGGFGLERSPLGRLKGSAGRWQPGMTMDWLPIRPLVAEVAYDTVDDRRFRHPAQFRRWRPDRDPTSCTFEQLEARDFATG